MQASENTTMQEVPDEKRGLLDVLIVIAKRKRLVIGGTFVIALLAVALSFVLPKIYKANTRILPPQQAQSGAAAILAQLGGAAGAVAGATGIKNPNDMYMGMLKSRTVADALVAKYDLKNIYKTKTFEMTRKELEGNTKIFSGKDGLIVIEVEDEDPKRAASIANSYTEELLKLTKVIAVTEASQRRLFFEKQLEISKNNLANAEVDLKGALAGKGVISVESDSRAIVETVARLRAQVAAKKIQLDSMRAFVTKNNQEYRRIEQEIISAQSELSRLENGNRDIQVETGGQQAGLENIKKLRDVKYHQMLYELLSKQYEVARLDEAKDSSIIQVLDRAVEPETRVRPRRAFITIFMTSLGFFVMVMVALFLEYRERAMQNPAAKKKWQELTSAMRRSA